MAATLYMDARLAPTRSLSKRGFAWLFGLVIAANLAMAAFVIALHAFPVPFFLGLDVLGVWLAFRASYRGAASQAERVQVSADEVRVSHEIGRHARTVWTSPTAFTRVAVEAPGEHETSVSLQLSGRSLVVARALSPVERADFAKALETAIRKARAERY
ncbi:DUF2244 domain-containing protein [Phenylobacterium montanum]|uniref:DUF2244 domain-containing protein n=1 Tax=Phenylobacterium montanum TaxID=2823693 RepID=A0A975ITA6_9CAUL|nr:DUF2244 domain-containing protein [Caulobacter sp. S6]QUD86535.1 DUF2244 domain-containing protein [Caulobacter sp. S6]